MPTLEMPIAEDVAALSDRESVPVARLEEEKFDLMAFELWQRASCPEKPAQVWLDAEENVVLPH